MTNTTKKLNDAFKKRYTRVERAKWYVDKVHVEGVNKSFNKASLISLALNWGNEGNRQAIRDGYNILILSDRNVSNDRIAIPALLASSATHQFLVHAGNRTKTGLIVDTGSAREVHHFALLGGYGA